MLAANTTSHSEKTILSSKLCNLVIHNTFLELVDSKELKEGSSMRRIRSLDADRVHCSAELESLPSTRASVAVMTAATGGSDAGCLESAGSGSKKHCSHQTSSVVQASSSYDGGASPNGGPVSPPQQKRSSKRAIESLEAELSKIKGRLDGATTVMVQNMCKEFTQPFMEYYVVQVMGFGGQFDFLYAPTCFKTGMSKGYGFVNFLTPDMAASFALACAKLGIRVTRAAIQGREAYVRRFSQRRSQRVRNKVYKPLIFNPDGLTTQR
eukprot:TRINITY_DN1158_c0_g4_i1.p1 TRINITY_DN1158_c0_g4~~TRINITY_DN1158_c0_g4_i1.p1  ORF type:complete len:267 (+),score=28.27 TRINITY_DN1158_c0_g4_i1:85-885(+)